MHIDDLKTQFIQSYDHLYSSIFRYTRARCSQTQEAEELVSEVFVRAWKNLSKFQNEKGSLEEWLMGITKHVLLGHWKKHKKWTVESLEALVEKGEEICEKNEVSSEGQAGYSLLLERLNGTLSQEELALLTLHSVDGYSLKELAQKTEKEPATLRKRFSRLRKKLSAEFKDYLNQD